MNGSSQASSGADVHLQARVLQRLAGVVLHRHVRRRVAAPEAMHLDQRPVIEAGEQPCFAEERFEARCAKVSAKPLRAQRHRGALASPGQRRRHVLLDRDVAQQHVVAREIDDAEAAGAEDAHDLELVEAGARAERVVNRNLAPAPKRRGRPGLVVDQEASDSDIACAWSEQDARRTPPVAMIEAVVGRESETPSIIAR